MKRTFNITIQCSDPFFSATVSVTVPDGASLLDALDAAKNAFVEAQGLKVTPPVTTPKEN